MLCSIVRNNSVGGGAVESDLGWSVLPGEMDIVPICGAQPWASSIITLGLFPFVALLFSHHAGTFCKGAPHTPRTLPPNMRTSQFTSLLPDPAATA